MSSSHRKYISVYLDTAYETNPSDEIKEILNLAAVKNISIKFLDKVRKEL